MNSSYEKTPILLIEDDADHVMQIMRHLGDAYDIVSMSSVNEVELYNYKATNPHSQILIVDLVLNTQDNAHEGLETIRHKLWPFDRTAFFVVFSQYLEEKNIPALNRFGPHSAFIKKEVLAGNKLSVRCLGNLSRIVDECVEYSSPIIHTPHYETTDWTQQLVGYNPNVSIDDSMRDVTSNISRSIEVLNELAMAAAPFTKAGNASRQVAIGVFGSCGRLEMREDSDIECTVYFRGENDLIASTFWNRITRHISAKEGWSYRYEGQKDIEGSATGFLLSNQEGERFENKFIASLSVDRFLGRNLDKEPELRDRHFQILTELRPVFNPSFIYEMKREMILKNCETSDLRSIVESRYLQNIFHQFFMDLAPESLEEWADLKRFCYRTLNVLALQMFFIRRLAVDKDLRLDDPVDWTRLFNELCDPGILKVLRFLQFCKTTVPTSQKKVLMKDVHVLVERYFYTYSRFVKTQPSERTNLRNTANQAIDQFIQVLEKVKQLEFFRPVVDNQGWLFGSHRIVDLRNQLN